MKLSVIAFRNISRNRRRSILSGAAIAIATMVIVLMFSIIDGMKLDITRNIFTYTSGHIRARHAEFGKYETLSPIHLGVPRYHEAVRTMENQDGVVSVLPRIRFPSAIYRADNNYGGFGMGLDFAKESIYRSGTNDVNALAEGFPQLSQEDKLKAFAEAWSLSAYQGELPKKGEKEILLPGKLAEEMGVTINDRVTFYTKTVFMGMQAWTFRVTGIIHFPILAMNEHIFLLPLESAQRFLKMDQIDDSVGELLIYVDDQTDLPAKAAELAAVLAEGGFTDQEVKSWTEIGSWYSWVQMASQIYNFMALFFFLLGSTVIINTTIMVIYERMKEIGTVAALGMTGRQIVSLFFLEAFFIAAMASLVGVALGVGITIPLSIKGIDMSAAIEGIDMPIRPGMYPLLSFRSTVIVFLYSVAVASLASLLPTRKAAKIEPVEALRSV